MLSYRGFVYITKRKKKLKFKCQITSYIDNVTSSYGLSEGRATEKGLKIDAQVIE
jgi:hypothetical protein